MKSLMRILQLALLSMALLEDVYAEEWPQKFQCFKPINMTEFEFDKKLTGAIGLATLYPRADTWFSDVELCLFGWYVSKDFSLAGYTWDTHHALLKMMSADPEQFFIVIKKHNPAGYSVWRDSLDYAQLWLMSNECPNPSPLQQAARSITGFKFEDAGIENMRLDVLGKLRLLRCEDAKLLSE